jgi:hypothetical protein
MTGLHRAYFQPWLPRASPRFNYNFCGICDARFPSMFHVPDEVWQFYVPPRQRSHMVCIECWALLTLIIDKRRFERKHGGPLALWSPKWRERLQVPAEEESPITEEELEGGFTIQPGQLEAAAEMAHYTLEYMIAQQ